jgi:hypothetical protein
MTGDAADAPAVLAQDVFDISLRPRPGGRLLRALRLAGAFGAQLLQQLVPSPSVHDVVVTRRTDGAEVLREPAGHPLTAGDMLAGIRRHHHPRPGHVPGPVGVPSGALRAAAPSAVAPGRATPRSH